MFEVPFIDPREPGHMILGAVLSWIEDYVEANPQASDSEIAAWIASEHDYPIHSSVIGELRAGKIQEFPEDDFVERMRVEMAQDDL